MGIKPARAKRPVEQLLKSTRPPIDPSRLANPDAVLTFSEWCRLNTLSERAGRRIIWANGGPKILQLSAHRIGIRVADNRAWQLSRAR